MADKPILLVDGEELVGCKQNRVLNLSVLAPESEETEIPVSCVEQGRWSSRGRNFRTSENFEFADLKAAKMRSVSASMERSSRADSDQSAVWSSISNKSSRSGSNSSTSAMDGIFRSNQSNLSELLKSREVLDDQIGSVFLINGELEDWRYSNLQNPINNMRKKSLGDTCCHVWTIMATQTSIQILERFIGFK